MEIIVPFLVIAIGIGIAIISSVNGIRNRWNPPVRDFSGGVTGDLGSFGGDFGGGGGGGDGGGGC
jgi:hypothetical protein